MLATLPRSPSANSPFNNPAEAKRQQEIALDELVRRNYITADEGWRAKQERLVLKVQRFDIQAPHFVFYVRDQVEDILVRTYGITPEEAQRRIYQDGLTIYTTLDMNLQRAAERMMSPTTPHMTKLREEHNANNAALVSIRPQTGEILAMVGSVDYFDNSIDGQVNMTIAERQPGSSFKPFAYVTAFQKGWTPATMVMDVRTSFDDYPNPPYIPENVDRKWHGPVLMRQALANSMNIPAVKVTQFVGVNPVLDTAHRMGITTLTREGFYGLALTLGGGEVKLLDMVFAYTGFANTGVINGEPTPPQLQKAGYRQVNPVSVLRIDDADGAVIHEYNYPTSVRVLPAEYAYMISDILSDNAARVMTFGPDSPLQLDRPAAAKTGTTNDWKDNWTVGYTPDLVTGVWVGNAGNEEMKRSFGSTAAAPIWHDFMIEALKNTPKTKFEEPPGLERVEVCAVSGLKPTDLCQSRYTELFVKGTAPEKEDDLHQAFAIDRVNGKLATPYTPPQDIEEKVFVVFGPEADDWIREDKIPQPPSEYSERHGPGSVSDNVAITYPAPYDYVGGTVPIAGNARGGNFRSYKLAFGQGLQPASFQQIGPDHGNQVTNAVLEQWDTTGLEGVYTLQLSVIEHSGNYRQLHVPVFVDNISPTIQVTYPYTDDIFIAIKEGDSDKLRIQAEANDNAAMGHVEFYMDGNLLGVSSVAPYNILWPIVLTPTQFITGWAQITVTHVITAKAFDSAGNVTVSQEVLINVGPEPPKKSTMTSDEYVPWRDAGIAGARGLQMWRREDS
jgi:membrane carboxypeptidase/penicillin-binding protein PbpC